MLLIHDRAEETTFDARERGKFEGFLAAYSSSLLPYMNKCLQALYPPTQLAQILGLTVSEMNKLVSADWRECGSRYLIGPSVVHII